MSNRRAKMFNKRAANPKFKANQIIETLALKPDLNIADIGSGGGYYTYRFAKIVGTNGNVYAVDTNQEFLAYITSQALQQELHNIITIHATSDHPELPKQTLDYVFLRNVCHHLPNRIEYFRSLKESLKPTGKIIIIEYTGRGGFFSFHKSCGHYVPEIVLLEEMKQAGYRMYKSYDFLSEQSFTIFTLK